MKIKMREHYQDANIHLAPGQVAEVGNVLGQWLLDNRKAEAVVDARHLDVEPQFEQAEEPPQPPTFRKSRRTRGEK